MFLTVCNNHEYIYIFKTNNTLLFLFLSKAGCCSRCAYREWRLVGDKLQLFCFKDYDALLATRPAVCTRVLHTINYKTN